MKKQPSFDSAFVYVKRSAGHWLYRLDQVELFYVEVQYHKEGHFVVVVDAFDDMNRLDPYLEKIEIYLTH